MSKTVLQVGYGMQGKPVLADLRNNPSISKIVVADLSDAVKELPRKFDDPRIVPAQIDVTDKRALASLMEGADVVVDLMPGSLTLEMFRLAVEVGANLVTAMYLFNDREQDPAKREAGKREMEQLGAQAKAKGISVIKEMGMEPGLDFVLGRKSVDELDDVRVFHTYGAGFPEPSAANNALKYKFTWSIFDLVGSCLAPAMVYKEGKEVRIAADEIFAPENTHLLKLPEFELPLECSPNGESDTLAALFGLKNIRTMGRYITRWGGHNAFWYTMAKCGFISPKPIKTGGVEVSPQRFCADLLAGQEQFYYKDNERDVALIRTDARGYKNGKPMRVVLQILDRRDLDTGFTAMQRTVGFTASVGAQMILDGTLDSMKGIVNPSDLPFEKLMSELQKRGISFTRHIEEWDGNEKAGA